MEEIRIPRHVIEQLERRWAATFGHRWNKSRAISSSGGMERDDPLRSQRVGKLVSESLRPPVAGTANSLATTDELVGGNPSIVGQREEPSTKGC